MLECLPLAVGHGKEGVCLQVRMGKSWLLLDCGMTSVSRSLWPDSQIPIAAICSHAHPDHSQGISSLRQYFPHLPIYCSQVTSKLLQAEDFTTPLEWRVPQEIAPQTWLTLFPAGHLPGAAFMWLTQLHQGREYSLCYTGDFFLGNERLVEGLPLQELRGLMPDVLIIEGTYGTHRLPHRRHQENQFLQQLKQALQEECLIILPLLPLGLAQEILLLLRSHCLFSGTPVDIWVDQEIAQVCDRYLEIISFLPRSVQNFTQRQPLFWDTNIYPHIHRLMPTQPLLAPGIVLLDITTNWQERCKQYPKALVLLPEESIENVTLAHRKYLLSDHSDVLGTTQLIHTLRPQHVLFVHGNPEHLVELASLESLCSRYHVHYPTAGKQIALSTYKDLGIAPETATFYEGELTEMSDTVLLSLPEAITKDLRWQQFADTGLIQGRWQGNELVIRGISQKEFLIDPFKLNKEK